MPDLLGSNLQQAQDAMQKLTGNPAFLTTSHDATGQKRNQIADRNWKVCAQNIKAGETITIKTVIDFAAVKNEETCPGAGGSAPASAEPSTGSPAAHQWAMPNLVGSNLQAAQDAMQKLTGDPVFLTTSHDATGQKRNQIADRNWKVCAQNVKPGETITIKSVIDFAAVKNEENCP